jgi:hypothetical protein
MGIGKEKSTPPGELTRSVLRVTWDETCLLHSFGGSVCFVKVYTLGEVVHVLAEAFSYRGGTEAGRGHRTCTLPRRTHLCSSSAGPVSPASPGGASSAVLGKAENRWDAIAASALDRAGGLSRAAGAALGGGTPTEHKLAMLARLLRCPPVRVAVPHALPPAARALHTSSALRAIDMAKVDTTERLAQLRRLMKERNVDVYSTSPPQREAADS